MSSISQVLAAGTPFPHFISGLGGSVFALVLGLVALALIFAGREVIKGLAFLVVGLAVAAFGVATGGLLLGVVGAIVGGVAGFLVGGLIGLLLVDFGMGLALGYFAYLVTRFLTHSLILAVIVGIILFFVGIAISSKLLELVTAAVGGLVLYSVLVFFGVVPFDSAVVSLLLAVVGFFVQRSRRQKGEQWRQM
jgi:hypothetical protein